MLGRYKDSLTSLFQSGRYSAVNTMPYAELLRYYFYTNNDNQPKENVTEANHPINFLEYPKGMTFYVK